MSEYGSALVASLPTGMDPSIDSDVFARYERRVLEIEHRIDDIRNFTYPTQANPARSAGDDGDRLLSCIHRMFLCLNFCCLRRKGFSSKGTGRFDFQNGGIIRQVLIFV
jgi:hypothetical protein